jgi:hypothetical protein
MERVYAHLSKNGCRKSGILAELDLIVTLFLVVSGHRLKFSGIFWCLFGFFFVCFVLYCFVFVFFVVVLGFFLVLLLFWLGVVVCFFVFIYFFISKSYSTGSISTIHKEKN